MAFFVAMQSDELEFRLNLDIYLFLVKEISNQPVQKHVE
jgi:hypothetical protein